MNMRYSLRATIIVVSCSLGGCAGSTGGATSTATTTTPLGDGAVCVEALVATGSTDPTVLGTAALGSSACQALVADAVQALIKSVSSGQQKAAMRRGVR
jgi:hypothetical protein